MAENPLRRSIHAGFKRLAYAAINRLSNARRMDGQGNLTRLEALQGTQKQIDRQCPTRSIRSLVWIFGGLAEDGWTRGGVVKRGLCHCQNSQNRGSGARFGS